MKRFPKLIVTLLLLAMVVGIFAAIPVAAATEYEEFIKIKARNVEAGHYTTLACDGELIQHSANTNYREEVGCLVDNDNRGGYWSKPYKFSALKDQGGTTVPAAIFDVAAANGNAPLAVAAFDLRLRTSYDCEPMHIAVQATTAADSNNWITLADKKFSISDWDANPKQRVEFPETSVYKIRLLVYDIGEANPADDEYKDYTVCKGDETRFTLSEIGIMTVKKGGSSSSGGSSSNPPTTGGQSSTRPAFTIPVGGGQSATQAPTQAPTQAATKAPTQAATQAPTQKPTTSQGATVAPTQAPTQTATVAPTGTATTPTEPTGTVNPSAPTDPTGTVDPSAPTDPTGTVDPSAPTDATVEPTVEPTEEPTVAPTVEATTAGDSTTDTNDGAAEETKDFPWIIVAAIAGAAVIAGVAVFFIIKKKKQA